MNRLYFIQTASAIILFLISFSFICFSISNFFFYRLIKLFQGTHYAKYISILDIAQNGMFCNLCFLLLISLFTILLDRCFVLAFVSNETECLQSSLRLNQQRLLFSKLLLQIIKSFLPLILTQLLSLKRVFDEERNSSFMMTVCRFDVERCLIISTFIASIFSLSLFSFISIKGILLF